MATVVDGDFEWDSEKAAGNVDRHGVSFEEAQSAFADPQAAYLDDGAAAGRMWLIGMSVRIRLLVVVHVERGERDRIISARPASGAERELYREGVK